SSVAAPSPYLPAYKSSKSNSGQSPDGYGRVHRTWPSAISSRLTVTGENRSRPYRIRTDREKQYVPENTTKGDGRSRSMG
ncbi:hypothetical protein PMAYCL1PPCAC_26813, partial [Pristionchus mayeri]